MDGEITDRADETKARADAPAGDAVPRLLKSGTATDRGCARFQTRSKKLEPSSSYGVIQLKQLASSRRAAPPTPSTPSTAPARSAALCHRLTRVLRSQATRLWPRQPPLATSQAHDSLPTHYAHADTSSICSVSCLFVTCGSVWMMTAAVRIRSEMVSMSTSGRSVCSALLDERQPPFAPPYGHGCHSDRAPPAVG